MGAIAFFPWLPLKESMDVGPVELVPYRRGLAPAGPHLKTIDILLEPYVQSKGHPIDRATLLRLKNRDLLDEISDDEIPKLFEMAAAMTTAGLAARIFFALKYWNSANFQFTVQRFTEPGRGTLIETRRLDGSQSTYVPHHLLVVARPVHASADPGVTFDLPLLEALLALREQPDWPRFQEAIQAFNLANSDSTEVPIEIALVLLNGAMERALDADEGREVDLAERFVGALTPDRDVTLAECGRFQAPDRADRFKKCASIRDAWIRDLFRVRGDLAHGRLEGRYPAVWNLREHLLLGGFAFPLVMKATLAERDDYVLTSADRNAIDAFEALCCADHFGRTVTGTSESSWHKILARAGMRRLVEQWLAEHPEFFDEPSDHDDANGA